MDKIQKIRIPHTLTCQNITLISPSFTSQTIYLPHTASHKYPAFSPLPHLMFAWNMEDYRYETVSLALELGLQLSTNPFYVQSLVTCRPKPKTQRPFSPCLTAFFTASHSHSTTGRENSVILPKARKYYLCNSLQHQTYQESR